MKRVEAKILEECGTNQKQQKPKHLNQCDEKQQTLAGLVSACWRRDWRLRSLRGVVVPPVHCLCSPPTFTQPPLHTCRRLYGQHALSTSSDSSFAHRPLQQPDSLKTAAKFTLAVRHRSSHYKEFLLPVT